MRIEVKDLSFTYSAKTTYEKKALFNVTFNVNEGDTLAIIGSTGSGKSTLVQHLNGLIKLTSGSIKVGEIDLGAKRADLRKLRSKVGMLFQYPEYQLFEDTVIKDVMFGPKNFGMNAEEARLAAENALTLVGLDVETVKDKSPFELSGGEKRRVAIAGVIASNPEILILDEPTAGLDPLGKREILDLVSRLKQGATKTVVMISHNMDEVSEYASRVLFLADGKVVVDSTPRELFSSAELFNNTGLTLPHAADIAVKLKERGFDLGVTPLTADELTKAIAEKFGGRNE